MGVNLFRMEIKEMCVIRNILKPELTDTYLKCDNATALRVTSISKKKLNLFKGHFWVKLVKSLSF